MFYPHDNRNMFPRLKASLKENFGWKKGMALYQGNNTQYQCEVQKLLIQK